MEEKIDVEVIRYFVIIAFIGLWSISFAILGYTFEHYLSISIFILLATGILFLHKKFLYQFSCFQGLLFIFILSNMNEGLLWDFSIIFIIALLLFKNENQNNGKILKFYSRNFFSCCYKYALLLHDIKSILSKNAVGEIKRNASLVDVGTELLFVKKVLDLKNNVCIYSPLNLSCEKEFVSGLSVFLFLAIAKKGQSIYVDDNSISILNPSKLEDIAEFQRFVRYSLNGNIELDDSHIRIIFF